MAVGGGHVVRAWACRLACSLGAVDGLDLLIDHSSVEPFGRLLHPTLSHNFPTAWTETGQLLWSQA